MSRPLTVLILTHYFPPEVGAPQSRLGFLSRSLASRGHRVEVLTSLPSYPGGVIPEAYRGHAVRHETWNGVSVTRTWTYARPGHRLLNRLANHCSFAVTCFLALPRLPRIDVILVESPPIFLAFSALLIKLFKRAKLAIHVADLWLKAAVDFGFLSREGWLHRMLRWLESLAYRFADSTIVVADGMIPEVETEPPSGRVRVIPNGVDIDVFFPTPEREARKRELGLAGKFLLLFAGTHGHLTDMQVLVEAASHLSARPDIHLLFVGDGVEKPDLIRRAQEAGLSNMTFLDPVPEKRLSEILNAADVGLITLKPVEFTEHVISVKVFAYMACAVPVVSTDKQALRAILGESGAGLLIRPGDPAALSDAVLLLYGDTALRERLGSAGAEYVKRAYSRQSAALQTEALFRELVFPEEVANEPRGAAA
jgi:colanic acid biosynthesis glycosyl transferase WcaI